MRHVMIRLFAVAAVAAACSPALAQTPIQLRFNVQPAANDPVWQNFKGMTLEKEAECYYSTETSAPAAWPAQRTGVFKGKTVLFNPGATNWVGNRQVFLPNTPPEPTNTLFLIPAGFTPQTKSLVCRTHILANGQNVTADGSGLMFALADNISKLGPPTATVKLDPTKLAKGPEPKKDPPLAKASVVMVAEFRFVSKNIKAPAGGKITINAKDVFCKDGSQGLQARCIVPLSWTIKRDVKLGEVNGNAGVLYQPVFPSGVPGINHPFKFTSGNDTLDFEDSFHVVASGYKLTETFCSQVQVQLSYNKEIKYSPGVTICINNK